MSLNRASANNGTIPCQKLHYYLKFSLKYCITHKAANICCQAQGPGKILSSDLFYCLHKSLELDTYAGQHLTSHLIDSVPEHGVALPAAGLAVGEQGGVEPLPGVVQHTAAQVIEHLNNNNNESVMSFVKVSNKPWSGQRILWPLAQSIHLSSP